MASISILSATIPDRVVITLEDGTVLEVELIDFVAESSSDTEEDYRKMAEAIEKLQGQTVSFVVPWQPVTLADMYRLVDWASYLHGRRN